MLCFVPDYCCNASGSYLAGVFRLWLPWRPRKAFCCLQRLIRNVHVSKIDPSESCVPNSGLRSENVFLKGAGHQGRLCSVEPQLQQRPLYYTQA